MTILGIETATLVEGLALLDESGVVASSVRRVKKGHAEHLLPTLERMLSDVHLSTGHLDAIAVSIGPGSFTGLRIGLSTAKGLCFAEGIPLIAVPTLEALASRAPFCHLPVCPMLDARKKEVYTALYDTSRGDVQVRMDPRAISPKAFLNALSGPVLFLGEGATVYRDLILEILGERAYFVPPELFQPWAPAVARLGLARLRRGEIADLRETEPLYLRKSEAELTEEVARRRRSLGM